ncbi:MAG: hypothetical protein ACKOEZ_11615 [Spartobacteria bacterium]
MKTSLLSLSAGLAGTAAMTLFLMLPRWLGCVQVDVIQAGGSLVVGSGKRSAYPVGLAIHIAMGIGFAFIYSAFLNLSSLPFNALTGLLLGSIHGVIAMLLVSILIMEHHPEPRYHDRGPSTGLAQLGAHMLYGTVVGSIVALLR